MVVLGVDKNSSNKVERKHMTCERIASCGYMYVDVNQREKSNPQIKTVGGDHFTSLYTENYHTGSDTVPPNLPERPEVRDDC